MMRFARRFAGLVVAAAALASCATSAREPTAQTASSPQNASSIGAPMAESSTAILFVGNSYFYYNDSLHNHLKRMLVSAGAFRNSELTFKSATIGGAALFDHPIDHLLAHDNLRVDRPFEMVIMAGQSNAALTPERRTLFAQTAREYAAKVRAAGGEPALYMTHAYVPPHRLARDTMIDDVASLYIETGADIDALVIPVGLAFAEAYRRRPDIQLHKGFDGSHPNLLGTYLAAATVLASVYGVSPVGNAYDYFGEVSAEEARFLQEVAQDTVEQFNARNQ